MGAGETVQGLRILAAPPEDQSLVPSTHISRSQQPVIPAVEVLTPTSDLPSSHTYTHQ